MIKAAAHLHSTFSYDGKLSLSELRALLQKNGVECALMTEHADDYSAEKFADFVRACSENSTSDFLFIPGLEVPHRDAHVLMIGMGAFPTSQNLRDYKKVSAFAVLAHPHRNNFLLDEEMREGVDAIEVWNSQYDGKRSLRPRAEALRVAENKKAFVGWDLHRTSHAGGPTIAIDAPLERQAILTALREGRYRLPPSGLRLQGALDRAVIATGRKINAVLKILGLTAPRSVVESIRTKV